MNYRIVVIPGNPQYNLYGISFGKNKGTYWANKSAKNINEVIVIFNNKNVIGINNNQIDRCNIFRKCIANIFKHSAHGFFISHISLAAICFNKVFFAFAKLFQGRIVHAIRHTKIRGLFLSRGRF